MEQFGIQIGSNWQNKGSSELKAPVWLKVAK
jgi:hypothetical protein